MSDETSAKLLPEPPPNEYLGRPVAELLGIFRSAIGAMCHGDESWTYNRLHDLADAFEDALRRTPPPTQAEPRLPTVSRALLEEAHRARIERESGHYGPLCDRIDAFLGWRNGEPPASREESARPWSELQTGGRFEHWLADFDEALAIVDPPAPPPDPPPAKEPKPHLPDHCDQCDAPQMVMPDGEHRCAPPPSEASGRMDHDELHRIYWNAVGKQAPVGSHVWTAGLAAVEAEAWRRASDANGINRLATYIVEHVPGEPSRSEGAADCAMRVIASLQAENATLHRRVEELERDRKFLGGSEVVVDGERCLQVDTRKFNASNRCEAHRSIDYRTAPEWDRCVQCVSDERDAAQRTLWTAVEALQVIEDHRLTLTKEHARNIARTALATLGDAAKESS